MSTTIGNEPRASRDQIIYANILSIVVWFGLLTLCVTYALYVGGILEPHIALTEVPQHWGNGVDDYLHATDSSTGWGWVRLLGKGDFLNFAGFAFLALATIFCYLVLLPGYVRRKDWLFATICILEVLVLIVAASGILGSGGH